MSNAYPNSLSSDRLDDINLNFFEVPANRILKLNGVALNATLVRVDLPISSLVLPTTLTTLGTFEVVENTTGVARGTGLTPAPAGSATVKNAQADFTVAGATTGLSYRILAEVDASIRVNFS